MLILETARLRLEEVQLSDAPFVFELLNSPNWIEHIGDRAIHSVADAEAYIKKAFINSYQEHGFGLYKMQLKTTNQAIGICGLVKRPSLPHPDIGFAILPDFESLGYCSEAAKATLTFAVDHLQLNPILGITTEANQRSQNLLKKIGLSFVKKMEDAPKDSELLLFSNQNPPLT